MLTIQGLNGSGLAGWWDSVTDVFKKVGSAAAPVVDAQIDQVKQQIRDEAGIGAKQAVMPYIVGSMAVGGLAFVLSIVALSKSTKK